MIKFSVLIATLDDRKKQFDMLHTHLMNQIGFNYLQKDVEILVFSDSREYPIGLKRNELINEANGLFTAFVDDDDWVSDDYITSIVGTINSNPDLDCIGIKGKLVSEAVGNKEFIHSLKYDGYYEDVNYYYRPPNHLNPVRKSLVQNYLFPISNYGEDFDWAMKLCKNKVFSNEVFIDKILYYYYYEPEKSATFLYDRRSN